MNSLWGRKITASPLRVFAAIQKVYHAICGFISSLCLYSPDFLWSQGEQIQQNKYISCTDRITQKDMAVNKHDGKNETIL